MMATQEEIDIMDDVLTRHAHQPHLEVVKGCKLLLSLPRNDDEYNELGMNISAQRRRQNQIFWINKGQVKRTLAHTVHHD